MEDRVRLTTDINLYRKELERIHAESVEYFISAEGRRPLSAFDDIYNEVPGLPKNCPITCYAFLYKEKIIGYSWVMEEIPQSLYYILHFVIDEKYRRCKLGTMALRALDEIYKGKYDKSELLVSAMNYAGLNFWVKNGYTEITCVFSPEEQDTLSVELNLRRTVR